MAFPTGIGIVDTLIDFPHGDMAATYGFITAQTRDRESKEDFEFPVEYMFKDVPDKGLRDTDDPVAVTLAEMDRWGIEIGMVGVHGRKGPSVDALARHPDRFIASYEVNPNKGVDAVRGIIRAYETYGIRAITAFPAGTDPQVPINHRRMWPIYTKCVELGLPIFCCAGIPGPRLPFAPQHVEHIDEVMYDFPELVFVTRHGCEPWTDLAVKLMLKWPGLHFSTSALAPKYYPKAIVDYANTRGADKIIYAGYFPMGLSLERIMTEMPQVPFKDHVWPKFLRDNARRVLGLDPASTSGGPDGPG